MKIDILVPSKPSSCFYVDSYGDLGFGQRRHEAGTGSQTVQKSDNVINGETIVSARGTHDDVEREPSDIDIKQDTTKNVGATPKTSKTVSSSSPSEEDKQKSQNYKVSDTGGTVDNNINDNNDAVASFEGSSAEFQEDDSAVPFDTTPGDLTDTFQFNTETEANLSTASKPLESHESVPPEIDNNSVNFETKTTDIPSIISADKPVPPSAAPQKEEEPIPSFMEWTQLQQKKMQELISAQGAAAAAGQLAGQNGHKPHYSSNSQQNKSSMTESQVAAAKSRKEDNAKNFASPDCGAKVIQSNPESQNANGVLSSSHDEYMLNKCGVPIWFVVELCEPLKIEKVSLGNLELFSSSPKDFEIGISDRYPTRDWTKLGPFTLPDIRAIHSIPLPSTNASTFGKFLKVNILSHHGTEHFCPLSLVRVNGISEYEVLESENTHPEDIDVADKEESALYEEPVIDGQSIEGKVADKSVFGSAKDVVINIVKKAAQVLVKSDNTKDSLHLDDADMQPNCRSLLQCLPNYDMPFREKVLSLLACNFSNLLPFLSKNSPWCGWDYCHSLLSKHSIGLPWQPEGFYASIFGGPSVLYALCNYHRPLTKDTCDTLIISNASATIPTAIEDEGYANDSLKSQTLGVGTVATDATEDKEKIQQESEATSNGDQEIKDSPSESTSKVTESEQVIHSSGESDSISEPQQTQTQPPTPSTQGSNGGTIEETYIPPPQNNNQQQQGSSNQQQQKESVFVRLSNRIKTLERNQSMTASYLEELSRRFKKQNEENHHINEGTKAFMNDSRVKFKVLEDFYRLELRNLRRNNEEIRERLFNVQLQRSLLVLLCLLQCIVLVSACFWVRKRFRQIESQLEYMTPTSAYGIVPVTPAVARHDSSHNINNIRKRLNSELITGNALNSIEKSKKIKKKKKKLSDLMPVNLKVSGPASAPVDYNSKTDNEFTFEYPTPITATSVFDIPTSFKENINPDPSKTLMVANRLSLPTTPVTAGATMLSTKVDSPFSMISSTSTNFFVDSGVSTSSRFAILASPGPGTTSKELGLKRSGSLTSLDSSSTSSYGARPPSSIMNGHGDSQSQGSSNGKKRKSKGLKALMPKIFDR
ncbi:SUN domain-containing ossification factor [Orchesella cincta]|uniref:SUN domain-containing ossification factor n=1 Tax=Orchesella cincta TaxID=48709 RepID=A0A1D2M9H2_ORCCI|nr:SUN domain-containing ossification factor [Orchesella cincta]